MRFYKSDSHSFLIHYLRLYFIISLSRYQTNFSENKYLKPDAFTQLELTTTLQKIKALILKKSNVIFSKILYFDFSKKFYFQKNIFCVLKFCNAIVD